MGEYIKAKIKRIDLDDFSSWLASFDGFVAHDFEPILIILTTDAGRLQFQGLYYHLTLKAASGYICCVRPTSRGSPVIQVQEVFLVHRHLARDFLLLDGYLCIQW